MSLSKKTIVDLIKILSYVIDRRRDTIVSFGIQDFASYALVAKEEKKSSFSYDVSSSLLTMSMNKSIDKLLCQYESDLKKLYNNLQRLLLSKNKLIQLNENIWQSETLTKYIRLLDFFVKHIDKCNYQLEQLNTLNIRHITHVVTQIITIVSVKQ